SASPSSEELAIAFSSPYLAALSKSQESALFTTEAYPPKLLYTLRSQTIEPPYSLGIRESAAQVFVAIVYAVPLILGGWSVGIQELRLDPSSRSSSTIHSRIATSIPTSVAATSASSGFTSLKTPTASLFGESESLSKPTS